MKQKILFMTFIYIFLVGFASASSPYGSIDVYYNDQILPGKDVAKPVLEIGEPFKVRIDMNLNQTSTLFIQVCSLGGNFFEVIEGPSEFEKTKYIQSLDPGEYTFEWTLVPTDEWAGGSIPLNIWYQINLPGEDEPAVKGEFTVAYCTISTEYYEGKTPIPKKSSPEPETSPESTPSFTTLGTFLALALAASRR